jgi:hypothetical protein
VTVAGLNRVPTERQYGTLRNLASGSAGLAWGKRTTEPLLRRGWVTAEFREPYYHWVRITPEGLRALAVAVERYGLPDLGPKPQVERRVCADCGSSRWRIESFDAREVAGVGGVS